MPDSGRIIRYECSDSQCKDCHSYMEKEVEFGVCEQDPHNRARYRIYECDWEHKVVTKQYWSNRQCFGKPKKTEHLLDFCYPAGYPRPHVSGDPRDRCEQCDNGTNRPGTWYRFQCSLDTRANQNELRQWDNEHDKTGDMNMNTIVAVAVFFFICMIGFFAGYLIHRKRKKATRQIVFRETSKTNECSA